MKRRNKITVIWTCAIVVVALFWGVALYNNARKGQAVTKEVALQTLRKVAELVVNREFDNLGTYHVSSGSNGKKYTKRQVITEEGEFEVTIDSLKEAQGLYLLEVVGYKADILNCYGKFPLEKIRSEWQEEMDARYRGTVCVLSLKITPLGKDVFQETFAGNETICTSQNNLGTYYLDNMYTMSLTAYMQPVFLYCIDWKDNVLLILSCFLCILLFGLFFYVRIQLHKKEKATDVSEKNIYLIGESSFDAINHTLTDEEEVQSCPPQAAKLLLAFVATSDYFLTYDEIAVVCGWALSDTGLKERRRKAINSLRKLFETDKSVKILAVSEKQGYQIVISK